MPSFNTTRQHNIRPWMAWIFNSNLNPNPKPAISPTLKLFFFCYSHSFRSWTLGLSHFAGKYGRIYCRACPVRVSRGVDPPIEGGGRVACPTPSDMKLLHIWTPNLKSNGDILKLARWRRLERLQIICLSSRISFIRYATDLATEASLILDLAYINFGMTNWSGIFN